MKKIAFLIIASLLVIGLVLPGCAGDGDGDGDGVEFDQFIKFAVAGPMNDVQGEAHWAGAEMARDAINDGGGVDVGGTIYGIELVQVDTNEVAGTPAEGITALEAVIDDVDFVVGGFRTESVVAYREVAMDAQKIFMNCGAATGALQYSVVDDYDAYKYWFKITPFNSAFLVQALFGMTVTVGGLFKDALVAMGDGVLDDYEVGEGDKLKVAVVIENLAWMDAMVDTAALYLPVLGFTHVGTWRPSATATDLTTELTAIADEHPHIIFTAISGPMGLTLSKQRAELGIPALTIGINVEVQAKGAWAATNQGCNYDILLDNFAEDVAITSKTLAWFDAYVAKTGEYPIYNAVTYDAINVIKKAIETTDSLDTDGIISYLETTPYTEGVASTKTAVYPMPGVDLGDGEYALSEEQVLALYPHITTGYRDVVLGWLTGYRQDHWLVSASESVGAHYAHDLVFGPGYATAIGSQWQDGRKVGVWPIDLGPDNDQTKTTKYGNFNFEYPGTVDVYLPTEWFAE